MGTLHNYDTLFKLRSLDLTYFLNGIWHNIVVLELNEISQ